MQDQIRNLLMELAAHRYVKISYLSIHMNSPSDAQAPVDTVSFEFKINGVWEPVQISTQSIDVLRRTMRSQRYSFQFQGSDADWKMFLGSGLGQASLPSFGNSDALRWNSIVGDVWMFQADSSFLSQAPFDLKSEAKPAELIIDLGSKQSFHGFRLDGGSQNPGRRLPNGFPDRMEFLYSDDGQIWTKIRGSESRLEGRSNQQWEWDRS
jgi:hypothetical protein